MLGLVDYGSDSSGNEEEMMEESRPAAPINKHVNNKGATNTLRDANISAVADEDEAWDESQEDGHAPPSFISLLPTASNQPTRIAAAQEEEEELEDFLKLRKDWERELAEQVKAEKKPTRPVRKTAAFGELGSLLKRPVLRDDDGDDDDEDLDVREANAPDDDAPSKLNGGSSGSALLKILPRAKPNAKTAKGKAASVLLPSSLTPRPAQKRPRPAEPVKPAAPQVKPQYESDDEEDVGPSTSDFFGLNSAKIDVTPQPNAAAPMPQLAPFIPQPRIYDEEVLPGPSRPAAQQVADEDKPQKELKRIDDQLAQRLIYEKELAPWGANDSIAREAVQNIREVSVDDALGPNVRETLLKNLNVKVLAQASAAPLPQVKKDPQNKLAKQKHQITHLAQLAVAREEKLKEQWADNRAKKVETAKKYGFKR